MRPPSGPDDVILAQLHNFEVKNVMRTHARLWAVSFSRSAALLAFTAASLHPLPAGAQSAPAKSTASTAPDTPGFSIETEMLTYRALESNSEAIACDIAAYLRGGSASFSSPSQGSVCAVSGGTAANDTVMVFPFDRTVYSDFQIWRSTMQTMAEFEKRGASACSAKPSKPAQTETTPAAPPGVSGRGLTAPSAITAMVPGGNLVAGAAGVLGLFATDHASSPVGGTIQDQALMDNVSRELRTASISVLMPSIYAPYELTSIDPTHSPFVIALDKLLHTRDCLAAANGATDADVKNIDEFLASLTASPSATPPSRTSTTTTTPSSTTTTATATPSTTPTAPASPTSRLESALNADGLARLLGADPNTGQIPDSTPKHILLLKALESGGSVSKSSNIFGSKMSYSGGSVGTYALFNLNGELECSGNVYDYAGYVPAKNFQQQLRAYSISPANQVIFQRGGCRGK